MLANAVEGSRREPQRRNPFPRAPTNPGSRPRCTKALAALRAAPSSGRAPRRAWGFPCSRESPVDAASVAAALAGILRLRASGAPLRMTSGGGAPRKHSAQDDVEGAPRRVSRAGRGDRGGGRYLPTLSRRPERGPSWSRHSKPRSGRCLLAGLRLGCASLDVILSGGAQRRSRRISEGAAAPKLGQRALAASALASEVSPLRVD